MISVMVNTQEPNQLWQQDGDASHHFQSKNFTLKIVHIHHQKNLSELIASIMVFNLDRQSHMWLESGSFVFSPDMMHWCENKSLWTFAKGIESLFILSCPSIFNTLHNLCRKLGIYENDTS